MRNIGNSAEAWALAEIFVKLFPHNEKKAPAPKKVNVKTPFHTVKNPP